MYFACGANISPLDTTDIDSGTPKLGAPCERMDLLFVVDDSGSMVKEQANLATNFSQFSTVLSNYKNSAGESLDFRIAVTTTGRDVTWFQTITPFTSPIQRTQKGDNGAFRQAQCGLTKPWVDGTDANVSSTLSCLANVGTDGPWIEMPLLATEFALTSRRADGTNAGFLRDDALLAVVAITDADDCSRTIDGFETYDTSENCFGDPTVVPTQHYIDVLDTIKGDRSRWAAAMIAGPTNCVSDFGNAAEAKRLKEFVSLTGRNGVFSSICSGDLQTPLTEALDTFTEGCEKIQID